MLSDTITNAARDGRIHVVVIGSGLGGLTCGAILAKQGYAVTVLEQSAQIGGCLQCFERGGVKFETGMHFIGSAGKGETIHKLFRYLEIDRHVRLSPLDSDGYDVVSLCGRRYRFPVGRDAFIARMTSYFPHQADNIRRYFSLVEHVAEASAMHSMRYTEANDALDMEYQLRSIDDVLGTTITDPLLQKVLVGNLPLYAAETKKTPFATHAFIVDFYNRGAYRIAGGSDAIARALAATIRRYGGEVRVRQKVVSIACNDERATHAVTADGIRTAADCFIADTHPARTLEMLRTPLIRPAYRKRIAAIPQTVGCFSVYLHFKADTVPYMNYNVYGYDSDTPWDCEKYTADDWPRGFLYMHFCHTQSGNDGDETLTPRYARAGVILSYMRYEEVARWRGTRVGRRGSDYDDFKRRKAELLLQRVEAHCPELRGNIEHYYTSTPLTYEDYTGTERGAMYGCAKDIRLGAACRVAHRTKVPNVLQTGQNINSHGLLGVLVGTIVTCSELVSPRRLYDDIAKANAE